MNGAFIAVLFSIVISQSGEVNTRPWECVSNTKPIDAEVVRKDSGNYVYDCRYNS